MPFIAFLGCDGSGKSTVIQEVARRLEAEGVCVFCGHWRPAVFDSKSAREAARVAAQDPHGRPPRGKIASILKLGWLLSNWWVGWWRGLRSASRHGVVLFDRYHADLTVDPRRYRYGGPLWLARVALRWMPQPDAVFFLDADPKVLLSRKQEVPERTLERSRAAYLSRCEGDKLFRVVDVERTLEEVVTEVTASIVKLNE